MEPPGLEEDSLTWDVANADGLGGIGHRESSSGLKLLYRGIAKCLVPVW